MKKLIIFLVFLLSTLVSWGQTYNTVRKGGVIWSFQGEGVIFDTTTTDTTLTLIGDGIEIGDGISIGDGAYILEVVYPKQHMKEEETLNELIS